MGKDLESLEKSRRNRQQFIFEYGFIPTSIMHREIGDKSLDLCAETKSYTSTHHKQRSKEGFSANDTGFFVSGSGSRSGALSRFPQNIGRFFVKFYSKKNDIVYDPFAGHNSRMQLCYEQGRNYIGVDVCNSFMNANEKIRDILYKGSKKSLLKNKCTISLLHQSSSNVHQIKSEFADYTITSPPYWDIEYYGDEPEQLGNAKSFKQFMELLSKHIQENFRILKSGSYCTWFINDFVKNKVFYCYHAELIDCFSLCGFQLHDIVIVDLGYPMSGCFLKSIEASMRSAKRHEYAITFRKG